VRSGALWSLALGAGAFAVALAYFGLHEALSRWIEVPARAAGLGLVAVTLGIFLLLFAVQTLIRARPHGFIARRLYPWFYAGLFLDEVFTRITFRLWPARLSRHRDGPAGASVTGALS
jgi:NAD(P)H-quinone oxidoreductase subunit 5